MTPKQAIERLRADKWSDRTIAAACGVNFTTVYRVRMGAEPKHVLGAALIELAKNPNKRRRKA